MSKPIPGYGGFTAPNVRPELQLKTRVSEHMALKDRVKAIQSIAAAHAATPDPASVAAPTSFFLQKRHVGHTTYEDSATAFVRSAADVPARAKERESTGTATIAPFSATTTQRAAISYAGGDSPDFFSRVRAVERVDDDNRHSLEDPKTRNGAAKNLRCAAIQVKRENDPRFAPPPQTFTRVPRAGSCAPKKLNSDVTKFTHVPAKSSSQIDFLPPMETAKVADGLLKSIGEHNRLAADRALVTCATASDLFQGTAKAREEVVSGFMGHVPAHKHNITRINGTEKEKLREFSKCFVTVTHPSANMAKTLLKRGDESPRTMQNRATAITAGATEERGMNKVEAGRRNAVRGFFTHGVGDQDNVVADQFCVRFRPLEGCMKHGPPSAHSWISDKDLRVGNRLH